VNYALDGLTYISGESDVIDHCSVTVYDGAGGDCLPLSALRERRNGRHTTDKSGDASIYTLDGSGSGGAQCYIDTSNFTVSITYKAPSNTLLVSLCLCFTVPICAGIPAYVLRFFR